MAAETPAPFPYAGGKAKAAHLVWAEAREWAVSRGNDPAWRIVLCGYDGEHALPEGWRPALWKTQGRVSSKRQEVLWLSPHCR